MALPLPTNRTTSNTAAEHAADHDTAHDVVNRAIATGLSGSTALTPANLDVLQYRTASNGWVNRTPAQLATDIGVSSLVYNVTSYGALGTGSTSASVDNTAFVNAIAALNTAGGGILYVPEGDYQCSIDISSVSNITIKGAGSKSKIYLPNSGTGAKYLVTINNTVSNIVFEDVQLYSAYTHNWTLIIQGGVGQITNLTFNRVYFKGDTWDGVGSQPYMTNFSPTAAGGNKNIVFTNCIFENTLTGGAAQVAGILARGVWGMDVLGNTFINVNNPIVPDSSFQKYGLVYAYNKEIYTTAAINIEGPDIWGWDGFTYIGNRQRKDPSLTITGGTDIGGVLLDQNCRNGTVAGNRFYGNPVQFAPNTGAGNDTSYISVAGNIIEGTRSTAFVNGCVVLQADPASVSNHIQVTNNILRGTFTGSAVQLGTGYGSSVRAFGNDGSVDVGGTASGVSVLPITTKSAAYTLTTSDAVVIGNATTASFTFTLPAAASSTGTRYDIQRSNSGANNVTVSANGAELIDGSAIYILANQYESVTLVSNGTGWTVL